MQRNQSRGSGGQSYYNDWTNQHGGSGQKPQGHTHPMAAGSGMGLLATPQIPPQGSAHVMGAVGSRAMLGMMSMYTSPLVSSASALPPHPQAQVGTVLHSVGSGAISSSMRGSVQQGVQKSMPPGHSSAPPAMNVSSSSQLLLPQPPPQFDIWDLACGTVSLSDVAPSIWRLGVPGTAMFVLGIVESFFKSRVETGKRDLIQEKLRQLINIFIFHQNMDSLGPRKEGSVQEAPGASAPSSAVEELKLILAVHNKLEEQTDPGLRYALFDALFGGIVEACGVKFDLLCKLVSLCVSLESKGLLFCTAVWMSEHSQGSVGVTGYLFREFCELLPDASAPLSKLARHSSHLAYQLASAVTFLYPFHLLGSQHPGVDPDNLQPPLSVLSIISDWVESTPDFLYAMSNHSEVTRSKFSLLHSPSNRQQTPSLLLPITGIIQWCILCPLVKCSLANKPSQNGGLSTDSEDPFKMQTDTDTSSTLPSQDDHNYQEKLARLHANLLSALLSSSHTSLSSSPVAVSSLSSDDVAILVANLLAFSRKQGLVVGGESKRSKGGGSAGSKIVAAIVKQEGKDGASGAHVLEQSVERFAQFLQISLSTEVLQLKHEDLMSISSTLPKNRLLDVVITHCSQQLKASQQANHKGHSK